MNTKVGSSVSAPALTPAMRAALLVAAQQGRVCGGTFAYDDANACALLGLLRRVESPSRRSVGAYYAPTPAGIDALRAEITS